MSIDIDAAGDGRSEKTQNMHHEHLGSLDVITDAIAIIDIDSNNNPMVFSFDAWGQRRAASDWSELEVQEQLSRFSLIVLATPRGFTMHEHLDEVGLIHMNGRIYDPLLARFVQADPFIQDGENTQSYNRYSYVFNNPLNATDPTGFFSVSDAFGAFSIVAGVGIGVACPACIPAVSAILGGLSAAVSGADGVGIIAAAFTSYATATLGVSLGANGTAIGRTLAPRHEWDW